VEQWGLTLGEDVGAQFHLRIEDEIVSDENSKLKITVGDHEATYLAIPEANEDGLYIFNVNVAAAQMTDSIVLQLVSGTKEGPAYTYSVRQYADYILTEKPEDFDDKTKALVTAMLGYGGAAQTYFAYNTDALASEGITLPASHAIPEDSGMDVTDTIVGIDFYGASLLFQSKTAIRYYFTAEDISRYTFTDGSGNVLTPVASGDKYYVQISSINPAALDDAITVLVTAADSTETVSVTYNAISYMARKFYHDAVDQSLKNLVQAIYDYHIAAKSFIAN